MLTGTLKITGPVILNDEISAVIALAHPEIAFISVLRMVETAVSFVI